MTTSPIRFSPSARDLWYTGSGQPVPSPTDDEIATVVEQALADRGTFVDRVVSIAVARSVRALFPQPTTDAISKDTV